MTLHFWLQLPLSALFLNNLLNFYSKLNIILFHLFLGGAFISQSHFRESGPVFYHTRVRFFNFFYFYQNVFMLCVLTQKCSFKLSELQNATAIELNVV